jgi:hypothetical protein
VKKCFIKLLAFLTTVFVAVFAGGCFHFGCEACRQEALRQQKYRECEETRGHTMENGTCTYCESSAEFICLDNGHSFEDWKCSICLETLVYEGFEYALLEDGSGYELVSVGECEAENIFIPSEYEGLPVLSIKRSAFCSNENLEYLKIAEGIVEIENFAFSSCLKLREISLPNSLEKFGNAFGNHPRRGCIYENGAYYLGNEENPYLILVDYYHNQSPSSFTVLDATKLIMNEAFSGDIGDGDLTNITIGESVKYIGYKAFSCDGLTSITFENTEGWECVESNAGTSVELSSFDLKNPETAANYLTNTYANFYWQR